MDALADLARSATREGNPVGAEQRCDRVLTGLARQRDDDVAVLAIGRCHETVADTAMGTVSSGRYLPGTAKHS
jgi:hypothetical protein